MDKIKEYCDECQKTLLYIVVGVYIVLFFLMREVDDCLSSKKSDYVMSYLPILIGLVPSIIAGSIYTAGIKYIRGPLWKKKFPQWDIGGRWEDITEYHGFFDRTGQYNKTKPPRKAVVNFEQKYDSIKILDSEGDGFRWHSMSVTFTRDGNFGGTLHILYEVNYNQSAQSEDYPQVQYGYEEMHIRLDKYDGNKPQRPSEMRGKFAHCVDRDGTPSYYGEVCYQREL